MKVGETKGGGGREGRGVALVVWGLGTGERARFLGGRPAFGWRPHTPFV